MRLEIQGQVVEWRGPAPFYFLPIGGEEAQLVRDAAKLVSYGWGVVPVEVEIAGRSWQTSLIPRQGSYFLPLKDELRRAAEIPPDGHVTLIISIST